MQATVSLVGRSRALIGSETTTLSSSFYIWLDQQRLPFVISFLFDPPRRLVTKAAKAYTIAGSFATTVTGQSHFPVALIF
jgi:hypothetical protein